MTICTDCGKEIIMSQPQEKVQKRCLSCREKRRSKLDIKYQCISCGCAFNLSLKKLNELKNKLGYGFKDPRYCYSCKLKGEGKR